MYRIVKRIVHTVTTVTWIVRWEMDSAGEKAMEQQISFPPAHSIVEEAVTGTIEAKEEADQSPKPTLDKGEKR